MSKTLPKIQTGVTYRLHKNKSLFCDREIRFKCSLQNVALDVLRARQGWEEVQGDGEWDIFWCDREWLKDNYTSLYLHEHQKILHFRNHYELTRKNLMVKNLKRLKKQMIRQDSKISATDLDFYPTTYELPLEYHIFVEEFKRNPGLVWIMKPAARAQGRGIFLFRKLKDIIEWRKNEQKQLEPPQTSPETYVVQQYIENPYLIGGRKFDLRVYVLVTSFSPLKVWLYRGGFARFSNTRYSLESIEDTYIHLTNVAIQKTAPDYDPEKGCKWSVQRFREYMSAKHGDLQVKEIFRKIDDIIVKSLQSVSKLIINDRHCFELYGYDVLLDSNFKPWLIEINASPSMTSSGKDDYELKFGLINDVLNVVDMEGRLAGQEKRVGGFDLLWDDGIVLADDVGLNIDGVYPFESISNSFLGCCNDRIRHLQNLDHVLHAGKPS